jgi:hypothetical protein
MLNEAGAKVPILAPWGAGANAADPLSHCFAKLCFDWLLNAATT